MKDLLETRVGQAASHPVVVPTSPALTGTPILWAETWSLALQELRGNKVRAMLTMLGVIIGSACIVLVVTVALVGKRYVVGQIEGVGVNLIHSELVHTGDTQRTTLSDEITLADMEAAKATLPHVEVAAGSHDMPMTFVVNGVSRPVSLVGVTEGFQTIRRFLILRGRYFDQDDMNSRSKVCLITRELAELAFPNEDPLGKDIRLGDLHFTVIGVFHERTATFGLTEVTRNSVIVPIGLIKYYTGEEYLRTLYVQADRPDSVPELTKQVGELLSSRHRRGAEYLTENLASLLDSARRISMALTILLIVVATDRAYYQRYWNHEYHAGDGDRTHARDRHTQSDRRAARCHPLPVSDGSISDQRNGRAGGDCDCRGDSDCGERFHQPGAGTGECGRAHSGVVGLGGSGVFGILFHGTFIRISPGESRGAIAAYGIVAL